MYRKDNVCVSELSDGRFYVYEIDEQRNQVLSVGKGNPPDNGRWFANGTGDRAIQYVGIPYRNRKSAIRYAYRCATGR